MVIEHDDLSKDDRSDKIRIMGVSAFVILAMILVFFGGRQTNQARDEALVEASQKFTLAQQVAAACAVEDTAADLGGICPKVAKIVEQGPTGSIGKQGLPGNTGPQGPLGPAGVQGVQGVQGVRGLIGTTGLVGDLGATGSSGATGDTGATGSPGAPGTPGEVGGTGAAGSPGADGAVGAPGIPGTPGVSAFPFTFAFIVPLGAVPNQPISCTLVQPATPATCTTG